MLDPQLVPWLRRRIDMSIQCAQALPHAVGGVLTQFAPHQLLAIHNGHGLMLDRLVERLAQEPNNPQVEDDIRYLALCFRWHSGWQETWTPAVIQRSEEQP